jgi:L-alanine-DL-glutamate epimerase-like enolase superfamily enzyme
MPRLRLELRRIVIPFRAPFRHAAAERRATESVWVEARVPGGTGYGEACPRPYVTGEDLASVKAFFARHQDELVAVIAGVDDVVAWGEAHRAEIDRNPAAWCAVEMALLDALARARAVSIEALLGLSAASGTFHYSAVVGADDHRTFRATVDRYRALGFTDFKLKLSGSARQDGANLDWLRRQGGDSWRLRLDANNLWATPDEAADYLGALPGRPFALEEPLQVGGYAALARLARARCARIILDESCTRAEQLGELGGLPPCWIVNVRVSKMGGILRSLRVVETARRSGIPVVVGAQVGETSLLARAALAVAAQARDVLLAQEGAFGTLLLAADVCEEPLMFGPAGRLRLRDPSAPGLGIAVRSDRAFLEAF